jgi:hypothetical protein
MNWQFSTEKGQQQQLLALHRSTGSGHALLAACIDMIYRWLPMVTKGSAVWQ